MKCTNDVTEDNQIRKKTGKSDGYFLGSFELKGIYL